MSDRVSTSQEVHLTNPSDLPGGAATPASVNITQLKGAAIASDAGPSSAATPRTVTASDSPDVTALAAANVLQTAANALQSAANALLATIDADTGATALAAVSMNAKTPALGSALAAASSPATIATDDPHMGAVGAASDVDGVVHGQLRYAGEAAESSRALLSTIDADTGSIDTKLTTTNSTLGTIDTDTGAISSVEGATTDAAVTTDADGTISAKLRGWIVLLLLYLAQVGQAIKTYGLSIVLSDGTNSRLLRGNTSGFLQPVPKYADGTAVLTAAVADNGAPTLAEQGVAFQADTKDAYLEIWCINEEVGVSNVDANVYIFNPDSGVWSIPSGGALIDLQLQTNNRWGVKIPDARLQGTRVYVEVDNYVAGATTISISAVMTERTT